jgi:hypothetical protein
MLRPSLNTYQDKYQNIRMRNINLVRLPPLLQNRVQYSAIIPAAQSHQMRNTVQASADIVSCRVCVCNCDGRKRALQQDAIHQSYTSVKIPNLTGIYVPSVHTDNVNQVDEQRRIIQLQKLANIHLCQLKR